MERELSTTLGGRRVDIRTPRDLSRYFRDDVLAHAVVQSAHVRRPALARLHAHRRSDFPDGTERRRLRDEGARGETGWVKDRAAKDEPVAGGSRNSRARLC